MEIDQARTAFAANAAPAATDPDQSGAKISSDFDTFLKLLTAQMKSQDPLDPMKGEEFASQLATFSNVEQSVLTNDLLKEIKSALLQSDSASMASFIGLEALGQGPAMLSDQPISLHVTPQADALAAELRVFSGSGTLVATKLVAPGSDTLSWDGTDTAGNPLPNGAYSFEYVQVMDQTNRVTSVPEVYGLVTEARRGALGMELVTEAGGRLAEGSVTALRAPS